MCDLCAKDELYCIDCGAMVCFDVEHGDDVFRPAYITEAGDLRCNVCGPQYDRYDEDDSDAWDFEAMPEMEEAA